MALQPKTYTSQDRLQPGARGELFKAGYPGDRSDSDRINRTNNFMNVSEHDVPNVKYLMDYRLPVIFKYGFAYGFNQVVLPKGRIVAADPYMSLVDFESQKHFNILTLANGGCPVRLRTMTDTYKDSAGKTEALVSTEMQDKKAVGEGIQWAPVRGLDAAYEDNCYRPFVDTASGENLFISAKDQLESAGYSIDTKETGKVMESGTPVNSVRAGNIPLGVLQRNEYTRDDDAFNGIMPGPVLTDSMIELAWFAYKDKAEQNPWGSAYGDLFPGALVKSDENGRFTVSPLSFPSVVATMTLPEYEAERQQIIGQIYAVNRDLVPEGAAKWAAWALEDRLNYEGFNPSLYAKNGRRGEDAVSNSPFKSGGEYPGYPYDKNYLNHDLHMLASVNRKDVYDPRMNMEYRYSDLGIPGLTDGYRAAKREVPEQKAGVIHYAKGNDYIEQYFRTLDVDIEENSLQIAIGDKAFTNCTEGAVLHGAFRIRYASALQGIVVIEITDREKADEFLSRAAYEETGAEVSFKYVKRGMAGVPTFMDWDGVCGSVKILLTK